MKRDQISLARGRVVQLEQTRLAMFLFINDRFANYKHKYID